MNAGNCVLTAFTCRERAERAVDTQPEVDVNILVPEEPESRWANFKRDQPEVRL